MRNYIQPGDVLEVAAPVGGYANGEVVKVGDVVGVSFGTYAEGDTAQVALTGVYEVPKKTGINFTAGAKLYLLESEDVVTNVASQGDPVVNNPFVGYAWKAAINADTATLVRLAP